MAPTMLAVNRGSGTSTDTIYRSIDAGASWAQVYINADGTSSLDDIVAAGSGMWLALAYDMILRSTDDGLTWTQIAISDYALYGGAANGSTVIVGGNDAITVLRSTDAGLTWAPIVVGNPAADSGRATGIAYAGGVWIVSTDCTIYRSTDEGVTWSAVQVSEDTWGVNPTVAYGDGTWVAVNAYGIWRSTDEGSSWTLVSGVFDSLTYVNPGWVRFGGRVWLCATAYRDGDGTNHNVLLRSADDGATWAPVSGMTDQADGLAFVGGSWYWLTGGTPQDAYSSSDGASWSAATGFPDDLATLNVMSPIAVGATPTGAFYAYDPGTDTWTQKADGPAVSHAGSCVIDGKLYVFGGRDGGDTLGGYSAGLHVYDPDADTWTALATGLAAVSDPAVATANGKMFVLGGEYWTGSGYAPLEHVHIYDPGADTWASSVALDVPHTAAGACEVEDYLYVAGGLVDGYHDHEATIDGSSGADDLYSDVLTVWMSPPSAISTYSTSGGWAALAV